MSGRGAPAKSRALYSLISKTREDLMDLKFKELRVFSMQLTLQRGSI